MFGNQQPQRNTGDLFKQIFLGKNTLSRLILINIGVFLGVNLINAILRLAKVYTPDQIPPLVEWLALPVDPAMILRHFWTIITYMFVISLNTCITVMFLTSMSDMSHALY